jgi:uncharacterized membrane protein (DUF4010 family)
LRKDIGRMSELYLPLGTSILLGFLVGLQRERSDASVGLRSFPLITVLGSLTAILAMKFSGWIVAAGLLSLVAVLLTFKLGKIRQADYSHGTTTDLAALVMYLVGVLVIVGPIELAVAVGGGVAILLQYKPQMHGFVQKLGNRDLAGIMQFVLITCIILPILPNKVFGPEGLQVFNPFETWLMVVLIVGMNLGGYITYKFLGKNTGIMLGGFLGGAISSTATTVSSSRQAQSRALSNTGAAVVILIASTVVYLRILFEIAVIGSEEFLFKALGPILILMFLTAIPAVLLWYKVRSEPAIIAEQENPTQLKSALFFGAMYAAVLLALASTEKFIGEDAMYLVAALSGMTDMDAVTLSTARLAKTGDAVVMATGWKLLVVAVLSNLIFKAGIVRVMSGPRLFYQVAALFMIPMLGGIALILFWPY